MAWQTPKVNWASSDVPTYTDMNRIEGNNDYIYDDTAVFISREIAKYHKYTTIGGIFGKRPGGSDYSSTGTDLYYLSYVSIPAGEKLYIVNAQKSVTDNVGNTYPLGYILGVYLGDTFPAALSSFTWVEPDGVYPFTNLANDYFEKYASPPVLYDNSAGGSPYTTPVLCGLWFGSSSLVANESSWSVTLKVGP